MKSSRLALLALVALLVLAVAAACGGRPARTPTTTRTPRPRRRQSSSRHRAAPAESSAADTAAADTAASDTAATEEATESAPESTEEPATSEAAPAGIDVAAAGDVELVFASSENDAGPKASLQALVKAFQEQYPNVTIKESYTAFDPYMKRVKLLASSDDAPDVAEGNQGYGTTPCSSRPS